MSEATVSAAVLAALTAGGARPYTIDDIKALNPRPSGYTEVRVMERAPDGPRRAGAATTVRRWVVLTRAVGKTYDNAQELRERARAALHEVTLTVNGEPMFVEKDPSVTDEPIGEDDGWFSGVSEFTAC